MKELYEPPHILIKEHESLPVAYRENHLTFKHEIVGIPCPNESAMDLRKLATYFRDHHHSLRFMIAFSPQYLVNRQSAILKADIDRLPYPEIRLFWFCGTGERRPRRCPRLSNRLHQIW